MDETPDPDYTFSGFVFNGGLRVDLVRYANGEVCYVVYPAGMRPFLMKGALKPFSKDELISRIIEEAEQLHKEGKVNLGMEPYWKTYLRDFM